MADLARIYHYYIHGVNGDEELPAEINEDDEDYRQEDDADTAPVEAKRKVPEAAASSGLGSAKKKARQEHMQHDASHVNIVIHAYKGENLIFKQNLQEVSTVEVELMHKRKDTLALYLRIHPKAGSCKFPLYLYYCPYILERETRPADTYEQPPDEPIYNKPIISSYWQVSVLKARARELSTA